MVVATIRKYIFYDQNFVAHVRATARERVGNKATAHIAGENVLFASSFVRAKALSRFRSHEQPDSFARAKKKCAPPRSFRAA
jgi:hypothetical protein